MKLSNFAPVVVPDEPLICPVAPGAALARLSEVIGAYEKRPAAVSDHVAPLRAARAELMSALENGAQEGIEQALRTAQQVLIACYQQSNEELCEAASFPAPETVRHDSRRLEAVDLTSLQMTFARYGKQVMVSFSFRDAPGATGYWLREVRYVDNQSAEWARLEDQLIQSFTPLFSRVRLPPGTRHFRIEARNPSGGIVSDEFTIEVPEL